jgi:hypothetical protein
MGLSGEEVGRRRSPSGRIHNDYVAAGEGELLRPGNAAVDELITPLRTTLAITIRL